MRTSRNTASYCSPAASACSASSPDSAVSTLVDRRLRAQHPREVVERGPFVVDGEDLHAARTPARNFGTSIVTLVPWPGVGLAPRVRTPARTSICRRAWTFARPMPSPRPASAARGGLGAHPRAAVADGQLDVGVEVGAEDLDPARARWPSRRRGAPRSPPAAACDSTGTTAVSTSGATLTRTSQALAEARLLEPQVLLDVVQLVGERHVGAVAAERVAGELGELGQQLARLLRAWCGCCWRPRPARCR